MSLFPIVDGRARFDASSNASSDSYSAGIRFTPEGAARSTTNTGTSFNQGIPMSESGQVSLVDASSGLPANVVWLSGLPISGDKVCISNKPVSVVSSGIPYDSAGAVAATVAPITTNATLDLVFAGVSNDLLSPSYTLTTDFITPQYQVGAQYTVWDNGLVQKNFADIVTFTRASTGTYFNSAGTLTSAAVNEARFDFNPSTLAAQGLLIEESRTNSIRNNTMVGAVAGTPGTNPTNWIVGATADGLTKEIVGTGTQNGITYVDIRWSGTSGTGSTTTLATFEANNQIAALNTQTWAGSSFIALVGGTLTNVSLLELRIRYLDSGGSVLQQGGVSVSSATATLQRFSTAQTAANASIAFVNLSVLGDFVNSSAVDFTLRIGLPQLEQGAFATSVIPTTTTALTRSADVASVNTLSPWYNATAGTMYTEFVINSTAPTSGFPTATSFNNGGIANRINPAYLNDAVNALDYFVSDGGVAQVGLSSITYTAGNVAKMAAAYATNDFALSTNGGAVLTDTSGTVPSVTALNLGSQLSGNFLNGYLRRVVFYPRRLANADLQAITT